MLLKITSSYLYLALLAKHPELQMEKEGGRLRKDVKNRCGGGGKL